MPFIIKKKLTKTLTKMPGNKKNPAIVKGAIKEGATEAIQDAIKVQVKKKSGIRKY